MNNILIATYGKLISYDLIKHQYDDIQSDGLYYGTINLNNKIYTIFRPDPSCSAPNYIKTIDNENVSVLEVDSLHTHEMIKSPDEGRIYWISTFNGILYYTDDVFQNIKSVKLANNRNHMNTIAIKNNLMYTLFHNKGNSDIVIFDTSNFKQIDIYKNIGIKCHNICFYNDGFLYLESEMGFLSFFDENTKTITRLFSFDFLKKKVFLKGLLVINDCAFIGVNEWGNRVFRMEHNASFACFDIKNNRLLWFKSLVTNGIINSINYLPGSHYLPNTCPMTYFNSPGIEYNFIEDKKKSCETIVHLGYIPVKNLQKDINASMWNENVYPFTNHFQKAIRQDKGCIAIFCNSQCTEFYKTDLYFEMEDTINYIVNYIFGQNSIDHIARLQFALLRKGNIVKPHIDSNRWSNIYSRIHVSIKTNDNVIYVFGKKEKQIHEGEIIEFNNKTMHSVQNNGESDRIHIIIDYSKEKILNYIHIPKDSPIDYH